jgi:hypothetical protein
VLEVEPLPQRNRPKDLIIVLLQLLSQCSLLLWVLALMCGTAAQVTAHQELGTINSFAWKSGTPIQSTCVQWSL